ncbi:pilin [Solwaraspora sp. WMMD1047]|uniref:pilin n=1 Tax=Solwaraspora sp. WMMD1047 TaxID=3016102 RepID=UPI002417B31D|nr:pilin [Solwaraspora sp. WMMD1047]MDG4829965.1 pilin [Solwaraspora sp. WMMD1047]
MRYTPFRRPGAAARRRLGTGRGGRSLVRRLPRCVLAASAVLRLLGAAAVAVAVVAMPGTVYAAEPASVVLAVESIAQVIDNIRLWLVGLLFSWATLCLTVGFLRYTSGDPGEVEKGKLALRSAAIGYAGVLLAPLLVTIVGGWVA